MTQQGAALQTYNNELVKYGGAVPEAGGAVPADPAGGGGEAAAAGGGAAADRAAGPRQREPGLQDRLPQRVRPDHRGDGGRLPQDPGELADPAQRPEEGDREPDQGHHGHGAEGQRGQGQLTGGGRPRLSLKQLHLHCGPGWPEAAQTQPTGDGPGFPRTLGYWTPGGLCGPHTPAAGLWSAVVARPAGRGQGPGPDAANKGCICTELRQSWGCAGPPGAGPRPAAVASGEPVPEGVHPTPGGRTGLCPRARRAPSHSARAGVPFPLPVPVSDSAHLGLAPWPSG